MTPMQCIFTKGDGERCKNSAIKERKLCYAHRKSQFGVAVVVNYLVNHKLLTFLMTAAALVISLLAFVFPTLPQQIEERWTTPPFSVRVDTCLSSDRRILGPFVTTFFHDQKIAPVHALLHIVVT